MSDEIRDAAAQLGLALNHGQYAAVKQALEAVTKNRTHLLTGYAGVGKTVVLQVLTIILLNRNLHVALCAPTHQAVAVLGRKLKAAKIEGVICVTLASLLSLSPKPKGDRLVFTRRKKPEPIGADIVLIDECSMIDSDVMRFIRLYIKGRGILFSGDPAQLPPVGEIASESFATKRRSHLDEIVRQAVGNPIISTAYRIRSQQGGAADWSWCCPARTSQGGVYVPGDELERWMERAFTSEQFAKDPTAFRYLAWTNRRVADINARVRVWRYGDDIETPFVRDERALLRAPIVKDESIVANTNEESTVLQIDEEDYNWRVPRRGDLSGWMATIPVWKMRLRRDDHTEFDAHMIRNDAVYSRAMHRIRVEADITTGRWMDLHVMKQFFGNFQAIYARTVHTAQGETHKHTFLDVRDIRQRERSNLLETQQLCYVGATRPTTSLILAGV